MPQKQANAQSKQHFRCVSHCASGGFAFAGIQYGSQCICAAEGPDGISDRSKCNFKCAGDSSLRMCGGLGYTNVYAAFSENNTAEDTTCTDPYYKRWYEDLGHCSADNSTTP